MTLKECEKQSIDVSINYWDEGWSWDLNGGYSSVGGRNKYSTAAEAEQELMEFLKTFEGFDK